MLDGFLAVPLHFTIEFLGFLVAVGGALLVATRPLLIPGPTSNRASAALGFVSLGVVQVLHGAAYIPDDGEPLLVALRALSYALILIGVVGAVRPPDAATAGAAFALDSPLALAPAGIALLATIASFSLARSTALRFYVRLGLAMFVLGVSDVLIAGAPEAPAIEGAVADRLTLASHLAKALAWGFVGAWLWSGVRSSIRTRFVASFGALLVAVILALSTALTGVISSNVQSQELERIQGQAASAVERIQNERVAQLQQDAREIARAPDVIDRIQAPGPARLARQLRRSAFVDEGVDLVIVDPEKTGFGAAGNGPTLFTRQGDPRATDLTQADVVKILGTPFAVELERPTVERAAAVVTISDKWIAVLAGVEVGGAGRDLGKIFIGDFVDAFTLESIAETLQAHTSLLVDERLTISTLPRSAQADLTVPEDIRPALRRQAGVGSAQHALNESLYFSGYSAIQAGAERSVVLVVSTDASVVAGARADFTRILFLSSMIVGAIALALAYLGGRRITRPIQKLTRTAQAVREGDLAAKADVAGEDEVGRLGETFNEMTTSLRKMTTDLRQAARQEQDLRTRIETIIQSMADGLIAVDAERNVLAFNREAENLTGVSSEEAIGHPVDEVLLVRDQNGAEVGVPISSLSEGSLGGVFIRDGDAKDIPVAITTAVLRSDDGAVAGAVAVIRDMTREREIERMKTEFLSNISHELRTPLTPIKGYAEILGRREVPPEKLKQFVRGILESTGRLERIVELLVDFSAMEAGRMSPRSAHVDVGEMLARLAATWSERSRQHTFETELAGEHIEVLGDERLLRRTIEEIVDNAVKFSPSGGRVILRAAPAAANGAGPQVAITVADEGIGIAQEDIPKIFRDFQQLDGSETRSFGGLGLGLAFVQRIVDVHSGALKVDSELGGGTRVTLLLPAAEVAAGEPST